MAKNRNGDDVDELRTFRAELAAALGDSWDWSDFATDSDSTPPQMENPTYGSVPPTQLPPGTQRSVTVGVARADRASWHQGVVEGARLCADKAARKQLWVGLPKGFAEALRQLPERLRAHAFSVAVFGSLGGGHDAAGFLAAAVQLERAGNILRQALHLGLPAGLAGQARRLSRLIGHACNLQREDCVPCRFRLERLHARALLDLKPREREEFVRLVLSFSCAGILNNRLASDDYRIRIACDCIVWNLESVPSVVPVAEVIPLIVVLERLREGGAP